MLWPQRTTAYNAHVPSTFWIAGIAFASYLLGSVSFGLLWAKSRGVDLRAVGSGNTGATNVARALGKRVGRMVLVLDALKGALPVALVRVLEPAGAIGWATAIAGVSAVVGHIFPVWHKFRGGKGAATGLGALLAASPIAGVSAAFAFWLGRRASGFTSVGSLAGAVAGAAVAVAVNPIWPTIFLAVSITVAVVAAHRSNIERLRRGTEPKAI